MVQEFLESPVALYALGALAILGGLFWFLTSAPVQAIGTQASNIGQTLSATVNSAGQATTTFINNAGTPGTITNLVVTGASVPFLGPVVPIIEGTNYLEGYFGN
jgi:hypothetical protein